MARAVCAKAVIIIMVFITVVHVSAATAVNCSCNATIQQLKEQIEILKAEKLRLEAEKKKLELQLSESKSWDVKTLMDRLFMYTTYTGGKQYKLLFHVGGLGGIVVYQYVGVGLGDAGEFRQYKQIAFFKSVPTESGFEQPGVVLKPVWGFNGSKEIRIRSISDLIKWEKKYNSIEGLIEYYKWMFNKYLEMSRLNAAQLIALFGISLTLGMVFGESKRPIRRILDSITIRRVTGFEIEKKPVEKKKSRFPWGGRR